MCIQIFTFHHLFSCWSTENLLRCMTVARICRTLRALCSMKGIYTEVLDILVNSCNTKHNVSSVVYECLGLLFVLAFLKLLLSCLIPHQVSDAHLSPLLNKSSLFNPPSQLTSISKLANSYCGKACVNQLLATFWGAMQQGVNTTLSYYCFVKLWVYVNTSCLLAWLLAARWSARIESVFTELSCLKGLPCCSWKYCMRAIKPKPWAEIR